MRTGPRPKSTSPMSETFRHVDRDQTIVFGPGALAAAEELLGDGYALLTTPRASGSAPGVAERAASVVHVPAGLVEVVAAELRAEVTGDRLVALGGGRAIDVAKALAAADGPREVVAVPTSLSGAEMTGVHRHAKGVADSTPRVRAAVVVNDPALSASQPVGQLAAGSANALGHAITALVSECSTAIAWAVASESIGELAAGWSADEPDRARAALGALLAGWAIDRSGDLARTTSCRRPRCAWARSSMDTPTPRCYLRRQRRCAAVARFTSNGSTSRSGSPSRHSSRTSASAPASTASARSAATPSCWTARQLPPPSGLSSLESPLPSNATRSRPSTAPRSKRPAKEAA